MSFYIYTSADGLHFRHEEEPLSVTLLDSRLQPIGASFHPVDDSFDCAAHISTQRFLLGYWSGSDLALYDLASGELQSSFPLRQIGPIVCFDPSGERVLLKSGSKVLLLNTLSGDAERVAGVRALDRFVVNDSEVIVPSQRKNELLRIDLQSGGVRAASLPFNATLFDIKPHPTERRLIAIDRKKVVHCVDFDAWSITWSTPLKKVVGDDHVGVGQYSGDGTLFGAAVSAREGNYTLVFESDSGELANRIESICYGLPYQGTLVRSQATRKGTFVAETLDLATGRSDDVTLSRSTR